MLRSTSRNVRPIWDESPTLHIAGRASRLTRSFIPRSRRLISSAEFSVRLSMSNGRRGWRRSSGSPFAKFAQELLRRYEERIALEDASDDDHRMRPHDVDDRISAELREIVYADDGVVVVTPYIVDTRFELNEIVDMRSPFGRPFHLADNATERKPALCVAAGHLLERCKHPILIEAAVP